MFIKIFVEYVLYDEYIVGSFVFWVVGAGAAAAVDCCFFFCLSCLKVNEMVIYIANQLLLCENVCHFFSFHNLSSLLLLNRLILYGYRLV